MEIIKVFLCIMLFLICSSCRQVEKPADEPDLLTYRVSASTDGIKADIAYRDEENELVERLSESLPWSIELTLGEEFSGNTYLSAEAGESEIFIPFLNGTVSSIETNMLIDEDAGYDFTALGVIEGDQVFIDPTIPTSALVHEIEDSVRLKLNSNLFTAVDEPYGIYHEKSLTASIILNEELVAHKTYSDYKLLSCIVKTGIER